MSAAGMQDGALAIDGLHVAYGKREVVRGLSLAALHPGRTVALVGPNGAGKSTLLRALAGLQPARGSIRFGDRELVGMPLAERARIVTYMPQSLPQSVSLTVLDTVVAALRASPSGGRMEDAPADERALAVLERIGASGLAMQMIDRLSGGQRQLAGLAQALAREPKILLLDEPTSALDIHYQIKVLDLVRALTVQRGMITVVVLHDLQAAARIADHVVVLKDGAAAASGRPEEAITPDVLAAVYRVRARVMRCERGALQLMVDDVI